MQIPPFSQAAEHIVKLQSEEDVSTYWVDEAAADAEPQLHVATPPISRHIPPFKHGEAHVVVAHVDEAGSRISVAVAVKALHLHWVSKQVPRPLQVSEAQTSSTQVRPLLEMSSPAMSVQVYPALMETVEWHGFSMHASRSQVRPVMVESGPLMSVQLISVALSPAHGVTSQASISASTDAPVESVETVAATERMPENKEASLAESAKAVAAASTKSVILKPTSMLISEDVTTALLFL